MVHKRLSSSELLRVQNIAWSYDNTRLYEQELQRQAAELINAKEIYDLNNQLTARNALLHKIFGRYFSDDVVDEILKEGSAVSLGGEKRKSTILLSDLRGFTAMAESMDPEELSTLLNHYFSRMVDVIVSCHGTVIEFMGDGLLAVFGALLHHAANQAEDALMAAIGMQNAMAQVNEFCKENGFPLLEMGIGVHTGEVFVGNIGSERLMRYNVVGNAVNICARMESCTVGGQVVTSKDTLSLSSLPVIYRAMGRIVVKGSSRAIPVFEVKGLGGDDALVLESARVPEVWREFEETVEIGLYPVTEKRIAAARVDARILAISQYHLRVVPTDTESSFELFDTVALSVSREALSFGWYAKVVKRGSEEITLRFTQKDEAAERFISAYLCGLGSDGDKGDEE